MGVTSIYPYQTQEVRDLAWACFSPGLMLSPQLDGGAIGADNCRPALTGARQAWLETLDRDATPLLQHLAQQPSHRLGVYFEQLWHFFLQQDTAVDLVVHNLPIHDQGRTLGEFDCIYYCHQRQQHVHLELAVKYFLGIRQYSRSGQPSQLREWPNTADRLDLKVEHLMERQIRLADRAVAQQKLQDLGIGELAREVEFKGYLFHSATDPLSPPPGFNPRQSLHNWVKLGQLASHLDSHTGHSYLTLHRLRWLSPARLADSEAGLDKKEIQLLLQDHFSHAGPPQLVAALDHNGSEQDRFFVTGDHWPDADPGPTPPA